MELIIFIIIIAIVTSNSKNAKNRKEGGGNSVWDQVDKGGSQYLKNFVGSARREQITKGVRDLEDMVNNLTRKSIQHAKRKEEDSYQKEQEAWRKKQEEERKRRDFEERQKKKLELQKKEAEQRRRILEREQREREEKALLEHCQVATDRGCSVHNEFTDGAAGTYSSYTEFADSRKDEDSVKKQIGKTEKTGYNIEEYLDPLTSSFYPKVDEYLSPTTASFYPDIDVSSFSLQNDMNVL
ncbi:MAG: hypothetical protein E7253_08400 [Lachnospiraceae bacterium]|nr:hypothetical protein [Lachnospiraceae bacterium]